MPTLKIEEIGPYETSVNFCPTKRRHIPQATFDVGLVYRMSFRMRRKFRAGTGSEILSSKMLIKFSVCFLHIQKEEWPDLITDQTQVMQWEGKLEIPAGRGPNG